MKIKIPSVSSEFVDVDAISQAKTPEELLVSFLMGTPVDQEFIDAMKKLHEVCRSQNQMAN